MIFAFDAYFTRRAILNRALYAERRYAPRLFSPPCCRRFYAAGFHDATLPRHATANNVTTLRYAATPMRNR